MTGLHHLSSDTELKKSPAHYSDNGNNLNNTVIQINQQNILTNQNNIMNNGSFIKKSSCYAYGNQARMGNLASSVTGGDNKLIKNFITPFEKYHL